MRHMGRTPVDPTVVIEGLIAEHGSTVISSPGEDNRMAFIDWGRFVVQTCTEQADRKRGGKRVSLSDLRVLMDKLVEFNMVLARKSDLLATTRGTVPVSPNSVFQLMDCT